MKLSGHMGTVLRMHMHTDYCFKVGLAGFSSSGMWYCVAGLVFSCVSEALYAFEMSGSSNPVTHRVREDLSIQQIHCRNYKSHTGLAISSVLLSSDWIYIRSLHTNSPMSNIPSDFFYSYTDLLLLWAENFYPTWCLHDTLKVFCNMHNKNIYNENWKIPAVWQQISVCRSISVSVQPLTQAA
jgi:hypothetical protein